MSLYIDTHSIDLEAGSSQYLTVADTSPLSVTGDLTIEAWVKVESAPGNGVVYSIVDKTTGAGDQAAYEFYYQGTAGTPELHLGISGDGVAAGADDYSRSIDLGTATWVHIAVVFTAATHIAEFFVNGVSQGTDNTGTATSIFNSTAIFGIGGNAAGSNFDGLIDEVRVWSTARTAAQILANLRVEIDSATNLVGSWHLDNDLTDSSGNAATLTNNGAAVFSTSTPFYAAWSDSDSFSLTDALASLRTLSVSDTFSLTDDAEVRERVWSNTEKSAASSFTNLAKS